MPKSEQQQLVEIKATRIDKTLDLPVKNRRLDSLARLLQGTSMCAAVAVMNDAFLITTNTIKEGTQDSEGNQMVAFIDKVMQYFKSVSIQNDTADQQLREHKPNVKERTAIFKLICLQEMKAAARNNIHVSSGDDGEAIVDSIAEAILGDPDLLKEITSDDLIKKHLNRNKADVLYAYGKLTELYDDFRKLELSILNSKKQTATTLEDSEYVISKATFEAFKHWNESQLLKRDGAGVHAEIRMLGEIIDKLSVPPVQNEIYIGISKLCCFKCYFTLDVANEVMAKRDIEVTIKNRGHHDLWHDTWNLPKGWQPCTFGTRTEPVIDETALKNHISTTLAKNFYVWFGKNKSLLLEPEEPKSYCGMSPDPSPSQRSPGHYDEIDLSMKIAECEEMLQKQLIMTVAKMTLNDPANQENMLLLATGLALIKLDSFRDFLSLEYSDEGGKFANFYATIVADFDKIDIHPSFKVVDGEESRLQEDLLWKIFTVPEFVGSYVTDKFNKEKEKIAQRLQSQQNLHEELQNNNSDSDSDGDIIKKNKTKEEQSIRQSTFK